MEKTILWLAFSGGAILLEQIAGRESASTTAIYYEEKENDNGMLRESKESIPSNQTKPPIQ